MNIDWGEWITWALAAATATVATAEFYGGKKLQAWIKDKLEAWWIRLSYIRVPNLGLHEALFAESVMRKVMGANLTRKRLLFSLGLAVACMAFPLMEERVIPPEISLSVRFNSRIWIINTILAAILIFVSLAITYGLLTRSIRWFARWRFSSLYFLLAAAFTVMVSAVIFEIVYAYIVSAIASRKVPGDLAEANEYFSSVTGSWSLGIISYILTGTRLVLFIGFGAWAGIGIAMGWIKVTIYRLFEAQKGVLTVFVGGLTAVVGGIKWIVERLAS